MKKLIKIIFITIIFFMFSNNSFAKTNYLGASTNKTNIRLHLKTQTFEKDVELTEIINYNGTVPVYSLDVTKDFKEGDYTEYANEAHVPIAGLVEKWNDLRNIAYFGHKYRDRTDIKWYIACQYLIWELMLEEDSELYFIDESNQKISLFEKEIATIKEDIANLKKVPSFAHPELGEPDYIIKKDVELTIEDKHGILNEFIIDGENYENFIRQDNFLTIKYPTYGDKIIFIYKPFEPNLNMSKLYYLDNTAPAYISRGIVTLAGGITQIRVIKPSLKLEISPDIKNNLSLEGFSYDLYYEDNYLGNFSTDKLGIINIPNLDPGAYSLVPSSVPFGYELSTETLDFSITTDDIFINLIENTLKKTISITSKFDNTELVDVSYLIKNLDTLAEITTHESKISLPYGTYLLKEVLASTDYLEPNPITFTINEESSNLKFTFLNKLLYKEEKPTPSLPLDKEDSKNEFDDSNTQPPIIEDLPEKDSPTKPAVPENPPKKEDPNSNSYSKPLKKPTIKPSEDVKNPEQSKENNENSNINTIISNNQKPNILNETNSKIEDKNISDIPELIINIPSTNSDNSLNIIWGISLFFLSYGLFKKAHHL